MWSISLKDIHSWQDFKVLAEAIGWHLTKVLKAKPENTKRIIFTEITTVVIDVFFEIIY